MVSVREYQESLIIHYFGSLFLHSSKENITFGFEMGF